MEHQAPTARIIRLGDDAFITVVMDGNTLTLRKNDCENSFNQALEALKNEDWDALYQAMRPAKMFASKVDGIEVTDKEVLFNGKPLHNAVCTRILEFAQLGLSHEPLCKFLARLMKNPSKRAVDELYAFLEHKNLPITSEGFFLAYKGLNTNGYSVNCGKVTLLKGSEKNGRIYNGVGEEIEIPRNEVDDNKDVGCSYGLHAGTMEYAVGFGQKVVIVEIDPADVVSIPTDCSFQKLRTCKYKVVDEYTGPLDKPLYESRYENSEDVCEDCEDCETFEDKDYFEFLTPNSSWITSVRWYPGNQLEMLLSDGRTLVYDEVEEWVYDEWENEYFSTDSAGEYYNEHIKFEYDLV